MVDIVVCVKRSVDTDQLKFDPVTGLPDLRDVPYKVGDFDRNALEEAVRLKESNGGKVTVITAGTRDARDILKECLALGADEGILVVDEAFTNLDPRSTAKVLAAAVRNVKDWELIICGEGSEDEYNAQVGPRLGEALDIPVVAFASRVKYSEGKVTAERTLEDRVEVVEVPLPALVTVGSEVNEPRYITIRGLMQAAKKPVREWTVGELGLNIDEIVASRTAVETLETRTFIPARKRMRMEGGADELARRLVRILLEEGVIDP